MQNKFKLKLKPNKQLRRTGNLTTISSSQTFEPLVTTIYETTPHQIMPLELLHQRAKLDLE